MACARASLPWARYRTKGGSAEIRRAAVAAASPAAATTTPAGSEGPRAAAVRRSSRGELRSCASPRFDADVADAGLAHHHAAMQEQQQFGRRAAGGMGREQPVELVGFFADLVAMQRNASNVIVKPAFGAARGDDPKTLRLDEFDSAGIGEFIFGGIDDLHQRAMRPRCR